MDLMVECILTTMGRPGDIHFEFHLDIGTSGPTRELIGEMVSIARGTGFEPKIKPESYAATCYATYTKALVFVLLIEATYIQKLLL